MNMVMLRFFGSCVIFSVIGTFILGLGRLIGLFHFAWYLSFLPFLSIPLFGLGVAAFYFFVMRNGGR